MTPRAQTPEELSSYSEGAENLAAALREVRQATFVPPTNLTLSEWADAYAYLSPETSGAHGKFRAFPYQVGIMDAVTDPSVEIITVMKSARVGYTKILDHIAGFFIHQDPCPMLFVQPRVEDAEDYSRSEIAPMLRDTPVLAEIAGDLKAKDSNQRILKRTFPNGSSIAFVGANSPGGFRRITARIIAFDEVDGYPPQGAGVDGDQIALGKKRAESIWNSKFILGSTPLYKTTSRILRSWEQSDQRRYYVPCPHCGHSQTLKWEGIRWTNRDPETVHYVCEKSGCIIEEHDKPGMIAAGEWIAEKPFNGHAGFHIWAGYSLFPKAGWRYLVAEFLRVKDNPVELRTFENLVLGQPWEDKGDDVDRHALMERQETWKDGPPEGILLIVCGVDVQGDRVECTRLGFGADEESWSIEHVIIHGDLSAPEIWAELDEYLATPTVLANGREMHVYAACIDTGGHYGDAVHRFCLNKAVRRIWPIKGASHEQRTIWKTHESKGNKKGQKVHLIGVDVAKEEIYGKLRLKKPEHHKPGEPIPGYCHFPHGNGHDAGFFEQLTAEILVTKYHNGVPERRFQVKPGRRNEALDCRVYALAALRSTSTHWGRLKRALEAREQPKPKAETVEVEAASMPPPLARKQPSGKNWFDNSRSRNWF